MRWIVLTVGLLLATPAGAVSGSDIYSRCMSESQSCEAYVLGAVDSLTSRDLICPPGDLTSRHLQALFAKFLTDNPHIRHVNAAYLIELAFKDVFPCSTE